MFYYFPMAPGVMHDIIFASAEVLPDNAVQTLQTNYKLLHAYHIAYHQENHLSYEEFVAFYKECPSFYEDEIQYHIKELVLVPPDKLEDLKKFVSSFSCENCCSDSGIDAICQSFNDSIKVLLGYNLIERQCRVVEIS